MKNNEAIRVRGNLASLVRYKKINDLLSGGKRRYSKSEIVRACSNALDDAGIPGGRSPRTFSEDIRVMRSDILGFNAPIVCRDGLYFYDDPDYSLQSILISDHDLAREIERILENIIQKFEDKEASRILKQLKKSLRKGRQPRVTERNEPLRQGGAYYYYHQVYQPLDQKIIEFQTIEEGMPEKKNLKWGDVFSLITSLKPKSN